MHKVTFKVLRPHEPKGERKANRNVQEAALRQVLTNKQTSLNKVASWDGREGPKFWQGQLINLKIEGKPSSKFFKFTSLPSARIY